MVVGGGEEGVRVWVGVWRGGERKNHIFHAEEHIYYMKISLRELISLSGSPLFALSTTIRVEHNSPCVKCDNSRLAQFPLKLELRLARFLQ